MRQGLRRILRSFILGHFPIQFDWIWQRLKWIGCVLYRVPYPKYVAPLAPVIKYDCTHQNQSSHDSILVFVHWFEAGGAETYAMEAVRKLKSLGHNVVVIATFRGSNTKIANFKDLADECVSLPHILPEKDWQKYIEETITKHRASHIYIHHSEFAYRALPALKEKFPNLRILDSTHIIEPIRGGFVHLAAEFSKWIDAHHTISYSLGIYLTDKMNIPPEKIFVIPLSFLSTALETQPAQKLNPKLAYKFIFVGRLTQQKRPYYFLDIASHLMTSFKDLGFETSFHVYGSGQLLAALKYRSAKYFSGLPIHFHGEVLDRNIIFENSDALISTSESEGIPLIFYEAIRYGVPCFATDVGQNAEFLEQQFLVPAFKPKRLSNSILEYFRGETKVKNSLENQISTLHQLDQINLDSAVFTRFLYGSRAKSKKGGF